MRPLTVSKLKKACLDNKYLLLRRTDGSIYGHNGKIAKIAFKPHGNKLTQYVSYKPCCINVRETK